MCLAGNNLLYTMHCISMYVHLWYTCILLLVVQVILRKQSKKLTTRKAQQKNESYLYSPSNDHTVILLPGVQQNSWSQHESAVVPGYWVYLSIQLPIAFPSLKHTSFLPSVIQIPRSNSDSNFCSPASESVRNASNKHSLTIFFWFLNFREFLI